ncbi:two-component system sensor histidine kinase TctE [Limimaricola variabilis]|uniref:histidine kinase n=1 Tax=Limimaricola variabilis TaxID=1492771 RepID=A0ABR6HMI8_9RHOB|nr:sensor histidine kinase [Limimaricola variabilis]MBB3711782.1 two-component system sensor histidine kinase TctE [Limimaricola variabilis]
MRLSLRARLFTMIVLPLVLVAGLASWARLDSATQLSQRLYDQTLMAVALVISRDVLLSEGDILTGALTGALSEALGDRVFYRIVGPEGSFVTGFSEAPAPPPGDGADMPRFYDSTLDGVPVRVVTLREHFDDPRFEGWVTVQVWQTVSERAALSLRLLAQTIFSLASVIVTAGLIVWFGIHRGLRPMRQLEAAIAARTPDDLHPIRRWVPPEMNRLVEATNDLLARLRAAFAARDAFISDAAHQIRNPIASLQVQAEALLTAPDEASLRRRAGDLAADARRAGRLTNQLLSMEKVRGRSLRRERSQLDLVALATETSRGFAARALRRGVEVSFASTGTPRSVIADRVLVEEMLVNLLDNALMHGAAHGGEIAVTLDFAPEAVTLAVADDGPGVPDDLRERIFDRFFRAEDDGTAGCGLGLAIARDVAQAHGGDVRLASGTQGARFEAVLPLS